MGYVLNLLGFVHTSTVTVSCERVQGAWLLMRKHHMGACLPYMTDHIVNFVLATLHTNTVDKPSTSHGRDTMPTL